MDKRTLLAVALTMIVITAYPLFLKKITPVPPQSNEEALSSLGAGQTDVVMPQQIAKTEVMIPLEVPVVSFIKENEEVIDTEKFEVVFSNIGGAINRITLKEYGAYGEDAPLIISEPEEREKKIFSFKGLMGRLYPDAPYEMSGRTKDSITYTYTIRGNIYVKKEFLVHNSNNNIELNLEVKNTSTGYLPFDYQLLGPSGITIDQKLDNRFVEAMLLPKAADGKIEKTRPGSIKAEYARSNTDFTWLATKNKYFSTFLIPYNVIDYAYFSRVKARGNDSIAAGVGVGPVTIGPGETFSHGYLLYVMPNKVGLLKAEGHDLDKAVSYGFFGGISKVLISVLNFFFRLTHNYGVSIILLTICVSLLLYPFTSKSVRSMKEMQRIQPLVEELRVKHKDSPQKMNKELMALYKEHKVNPLGGCLPMLFQMPVFIALYQGLVNTVELRGASFLWIKDLSGPDKAFQLPGGVSIPVLGSYINILPLIMMCTMFLQQKLYASKSATGQQAEQQKMMAVMMPLMFGFMFYSLPSGLVLYWLTNMIIMAGIQVYTLKHD